MRDLIKGLALLGLAGVLIYWAVVLVVGSTALLL